MGNDTIIQDKVFVGERPLFGSDRMLINRCTFKDGESPLKESRNLEILNSSFEWKYPIWYCKNVDVKSTHFKEGSRAGIWYTDDIKVADCRIDSPKNFRRCNRVGLFNIEFTDAKETLWSCTDVTIDTVSVNDDYFAMNCTGIRANNLTVNGHYPFDGCKDVYISSSTLDTKDAFWNCRDVYVKDSVIKGEYIGWNSENITFENCTIESLQGLCYIKNLKMINCRLENTTLAFEYSTVDADITTKIDSIINPSGGRIVCRGVGELIIEEDKVDPSATEIVIKEI